jgi:hypothetical protein
VEGVGGRSREDRGAGRTTADDRRLDEALAAARPDHDVSRAAGNRAVNRLLADDRPPSATTRPGAAAVPVRQPKRISRTADVVRRVTDVQAFTIATGIPGVDVNWFHRVYWPAMLVAASRAGQDIHVFLAGKTPLDVTNDVNALRTAPQQDADPGAFARMAGVMNTYNFDDSAVYPGMKRLRDTNLLVHNMELAGGAPSAHLTQFIQAYLHGGVTWYRGVGINHFAWGALQLRGVLASEGTADIPTFTMGNATPTRWIPGVNDRGTAEVIAQTVPQSEPGLRDLLARNIPFPSGAILRLHVATPMSVAYINAGEQVVRGPLPPAAVTVDAVCVLDAAGFRQTAANTQPTALPIGSPYQAAAGSAPMLAWEPLAQNWANAHP